MNIKILQPSFKMRTFLKIFFLMSIYFLITGLNTSYSLNEVKHTQQQILDNKIFYIREDSEKRLENLEKEVQDSDRNKRDVKVDSHLKYILEWTDRKMSPFVYIGKGQEVFMKNNCKFTNCFVTDNRSFLGDISKFDVIAFGVHQLVITKKKPEKRSPHQKYAFATIESSDNYPKCSKRYDNFFNWTWTYKLDSDSKWGYIVVRNAAGKVIGPKVDMKWMRKDDMKPVSNEVEVKLKKKTKAAAWFVSNCVSRSRREVFAYELNVALKAYNLSVDVFGKCGKLKCGRDREKECGKILERDYYFYLSFENSFSEDYVTEKLLRGLKNYAVPIVYGGANYSRFLPDGIYLNARELEVQNLAREMKFLIDNPELYKEYFRWRNHYSFHRRIESPETDDYCGFCSLLNNKELVKKTSIYTDFSKWWTSADRCKGKKV